MAESSYKTHLLPHNPNPSLVQSFSLLNRDALRMLPRLLLYQRHESEWTQEDWASLARDKSRFNFVCVKKSTTEGATSLEEGKWIGMCSFTGPLSQQDYDGLGSRGEDDPLLGADSEETRWYGHRLFLRAADRNMEAMSSLHHTSTNFLREFTRELLGDENGTISGRDKKMAARIHGITFAPDLEGFYGALGARETGRATLVEDLRCRGSLPYVPKELLCEEDYSERSIKVYEYLLDC
ncbi:MAG: hypothetical protein M1837_005080 [Sclerophora amabilis]|nr:MAG: hypothetical protein M1837_005080 [Sclerophora amabilis]